MVDIHHGSTPAVRSGPPLGPVFVAEYRLLLRSVATKGRLLAIGALAVVSFITALGVKAQGEGDPLSIGVGFVNGNIATLLPVAVLVFGAGVIGDLIDDGSLVYLWLRPVPTWIHVLAAWAATVTVTLPLVLAPVLLATAIIDTTPKLLIAGLVGGVVAIAAYSAIFVMAGIRFKRALPWGLLYILIWEGYIASAGKTATKLAVRSYIRSILGSITDTTLKLGNFSLVIGIIVPLAVGVLALVYASRRLADTDVA